MCIICYSPAGTMPTEYDLINCNSNNPDGFGWAVRTPNGIVTGRSMDSDRAIDMFLDIRSKHEGYDALYHARITTHGSTNLDNTHPFTVIDDRTVLAHNGMLPIDVPKGDTRSDTRVFAEERLPRLGLGVLDKPKSRRKLEKWASGSKLVIMTERADMRKPVYILNESSGEWHEGMWFSNSTYSYASRWYSTTMNNASAWDDYEIECLNPNCGAMYTYDSPSIANGVCSWCNSCLDCGYGTGDCFCYVPANWQGSQLEYDYDI